MAFLTPDKALPVCYLAGPYSKGDQTLNTLSQLRLMHKLMDDKIVAPVAPLLSHFSQFIQLRTWSSWLQYDYNVIRKCDVLLRSPAVIGECSYYQTESSGADCEVKFATELGIPVFDMVCDLYEWATTRQSDK